MARVEVAMLEELTSVDEAASSLTSATRIVSDMNL